MKNKRQKLETFLFFRQGHFYPVEIQRDHVAENAAINPGTLKVEDMEGNVVWRPQ